MVAYRTHSSEHIDTMVNRLLNETVGKTQPSSLDAAPEIASHFGPLRNVVSLNTIALHASNIRA